MCTTYPRRIQKIEGSISEEVQGAKAANSLAVRIKVEFPNSLVSFHRLWLVVAYYWQLSSTIPEISLQHGRFSIDWPAWQKGLLESWSNDDLAVIWEPRSIANLDSS
jgi:hypothetical protein